MFTNYLKIAWRNLIKNKAFSFINIFGLAIGLASFTLIALYVIDELSFDSYNKNADRIYRVNSDIRFGGTDLNLAVTSDPMGATLKRDYPQVEQYARIYAASGSKGIKKDNVFITEQRVAYADSTLFDVFTLPAIEGDPKTALNEPNTVVITESIANKYFGTTHAIGKMVETNDAKGDLYKVTAVIADMPHNSHFNLDFIFSMDNADYDWGNYLSHNFSTYILLKKGANANDFKRIFPEVINKYVLRQAKELMHVNTDDFEKSGNKIQYSLIPLKDIHLHSNRTVELGVNGSIQYVYIFSAVAIFVLLIACINFMNLSTARSVNRAKEVGIRKMLGTERKSLIFQFLAESVFTVFIALVLSLLIAKLALPFFNTIAAKSLSLTQLFTSKLVLLFLALPLIVGVIAGSYPAFFLSSFRPISVLKGKFNAGNKRSYLRSSLVVFQFTTSIFLIIGTIVVFRQINYIQTKKLGFNKDHVIVVNQSGSLGSNADAFKNAVLAMPGVISGTYSGFLPVSSSARNDNTFSKDAVMTSANGLNMQIWRVDYDYLKTMGMEIIKGRNFSKDFGSDSTGILINETTANLLAYNDPIGQKIYSNEQDGSMKPHTILGVVKNFHFESLRQQIGPLSMVLRPSRWLASFRVNTADIPGLIGKIESTWKTMVTDVPFSYRFLDASFDEMYRSEQRIGKVAISFAVLAILIACLGLFGLATYMAEQRTKEIGVRKVLGASVTNITAMLSKDFLKLIIIAAVIAFPVAWWFMHKWLQDFAYRVNIGWWVFVAAGVLALFIALLTVSLQAIKAALANPVKSLRTE